MIGDLCPFVPRVDGLKSLRYVVISDWEGGEDGVAVKLQDFALFGVFALVVHGHTRRVHLSQGGRQVTDAVGVEWDHLIAAPVTGEVVVIVNPHLQERERERERMQMMRDCPHVFT